VQKTNLAIGVVLVYDATALPEIRLLRTVEVGNADCSRRPIAFLADGGQSRLVFVPNPSDGTLSLLDGKDDRLLETVKVSDRPIGELNFSLLGAENLYGC
jgi:hypothetical protein